MPAVDTTWRDLFEISGTHDLAVALGGRHQAVAAPLVDLPPRPGSLLEQGTTWFRSPVALAAAPVARGHTGRALATCTHVRMDPA